MTRNDTPDIVRLIIFRRPTPPRHQFIAVVVVVFVMLFLFLFLSSFMCVYVYVGVLRRFNLNSLYLE